ncbi:outer membrane protein assembly factor BamA [Candidatus Pseudothioglobus singularis]|nr:outer membrane protein assembly factor BamA [Candidatus Pseudothioglobus singularis]
MKNKSNQLLAFLLLFFTSHAYSESINEINFIGLNNASEELLLQKLPINIGDEYSDSSGDIIIQSLFNTGLFSDISIKIINGKLDVLLEENPLIKYVEFDQDIDKGISAWLNQTKPHLNSEKLEELLLSESFSSGDIFTDKKLNNFISILESKYLQNGYFNTLIDSKVDIDSQNRAGVIFRIKQGKRAKIESFEIIGASKINKDELLKLFAIGEADMAVINYFTNKDLFTESEFQSGIDSMANKYYDSGYLDFIILNAETSLNEAKDEISINLEITEGVQYFLGDVSFNGDLAGFSIKELNNTVNLTKGNIFNRNLVIQSIQNLTDLFADKGYAFVEVSPITSETENKVNIDFNISQNKKVYINRISISGNTRTQDDVIRREIGISEGGLYSRSILRDSLLKLRRLGYFSDVQISTSEVSNMPDKININFSVKETQTGAISFTMSHSNNYGISFGAGIEEKNIFGSGNTLNAQIKVSESFNKVSFYFMNPNYNDAGHSVSIGAFRSEINDDDVAVNSYEIDSSGASFGYGIPLSNNTNIFGDLEYSKNTIKCSALFSGTGYESSQCATSKNDEFKATISWSENSLNNYLYPTEGVNNSIVGGLSLPLGDYRYYSLSANHSGYTPISDNTTLKLTGNFNLAKGYSNKELPFYKRYFGGGSGSVRGFGNKTLGPTYPNSKAKGGEISILASANLITPAFFFNNNEKMRMSAFVDAGNIFEKSSNIDLGDLRMSAGFGFAYLSPIGSIGAFVSTPILKKDGDTIENFGFSLGTGF